MSEKKKEQAKTKLVPLTRITAKSIFGNVKTMVNDFIQTEGKGKAEAVDGKVVSSFRCFGVIKSSETKTKDWGKGETTDSEEFRGDIYAQIVGDETRQFRSGKLFVPSMVEALMKEELANMPEDSTGANFAIEVQVIADSESNVGYHYNVEMPLAPKATDSILALAAAFDK